MTYQWAASSKLEKGSPPYREQEGFFREIYPERANLPNLPDKVSGEMDIFAPETGKRQSGGYLKYIYPLTSGN